MHTRPRINHKLSLLPAHLLRHLGEPTFLASEKNVEIVVRFELVCICGKIPSLVLGTSLLSFSLFVGPNLEFKKRMDFADVEVWLVFFPSDGPFLSRTLAWRSVDFVNRTLWIAFKTFCIKFPRNSFVPGEASASESCDTTQLLHTFHNSHSAFVFTFSSFWEAFLRPFYLVVHQPCNEETNTRLLTLQPVFDFIRMALGRMPLFTRRSRAGTSQMIPARSSKNGPMVTFCLGYFSSSTHVDLVMRLARKVWRQCVLIFAHDLGFHAGNCNGLLANAGLLLSTGNRYLSLLQRQRFPFDSLPPLQTRFSHAWRQSFVNGVADPYIFSPWFSTFES